MVKSLFSMCDLNTSIDFLCFPGGVVVKNLPTNAGDVKDEDSVPGSERSPGGENDNPPQNSCLESSMDRGAWQESMGSQRGGHD